MAKMTDHELKGLLQAAKKDALAGISATELVEERQKALDYYFGDMSEDMPHAEGRSGVVSTDVADTIEGLMPSLMEIFVSGDDVVEFEPVGAEDEAAAAQETDYVNHVFMQKNPGFLVLYGFIKDALLSKVGIVKVWWETGETEETETYHDLSDEAFAAISADEEVEIQEHSERPDPLAVEAFLDSSPGAAVTPTILAELPKRHDVTIARRKEYGCAKVMGVPPEEFGIERNARSLRECNYCFHQVRRTEAELIADGYDEEDVKTLPSDTEVQSEEQKARDTVEERQGAQETTNKAARRIKITEHYVRMRYDGEKARLYRVTTAGDEAVILSRPDEPVAVPIDVIPFAAMTPVIVTHRFFGRSIADLVMDIQRIKTALLRALMDNAYLANNPRVEIAEAHAHANTLDDLLTSRPGGIVRTKTPGGLNVISHPPIGGHVFPLVEYFDQTREWRTGVTRQGQGIDANALQNQSATAVSQMFTMAQARMKLIARIFAETGIRDMFSLLHATIRKNDREISTVKLRGECVQVNPRAWKTRSDMTIRVGLGTGSKDAQIAHLMNLLGIQREAIQAPQLGLVKARNIYNTLKRLIELIGLKSVDQYFTDPEARDENGNLVNVPAEPPPDPKMLELQAKAQFEERKLQLQTQLEQARLEREAQTEFRQAEADIMVEREKFNHQAQMEVLRFEFEKQIKLLELNARVNEQTGQIEEISQAMANEALATQTAQMVAQFLQQHSMSKPKRMAFRRDEYGRLAGGSDGETEIAVVRDEQGNLVGAEVLPTDGGM